MRRQRPNSVRVILPHKRNGERSSSSLDGGGMDIFKYYVPYIHLYHLRWKALKSATMRRGVGIAGLQKGLKTREQFNKVGEDVAKMRMQQMTEQLRTFKSYLEEFARKHKKDIKRDPNFRTHFHKMCATCGVDPLASNKGFWAEILGIGDFYYELGVQIIEICFLSRPYNGGLLDLEELRKRLSLKRKNSKEPITEDDCVRAISKLKILGSGFEICIIGKKKFIRSVPTELNNDQNFVLEVAQSKGFITSREAELKLGWTSERVVEVLDILLKEGFVMVDDGHKDGERRYWFPCVSSNF